MWVVEEGALPEKEVEGPLAGAVVLGEEIDFWAMELLVEGGIPMDGEGKGLLFPFFPKSNFHMSYFSYFFVNLQANFCHLLS